MNNPAALHGVTDKPTKAPARRVVKVSLWIFEHWVTLFLMLFGVYWLTPFLAPIFLHLGWSEPARLIYTVYSTQCHQMAQRSFFLFGPQPMYNLSQLPITTTGNEITDMLTSRAFIGDPQLGWKVAWSDRMVYMYGGMLLAAFIFALWNRNHEIGPLRFPYFVLLLLPMILDGGTHWLSDLSGSLISGFRYDNSWLASLTGQSLPSWFYAGDSLGSFNSWMRMLSGVLFGIGVIWFCFPVVGRTMKEAVGGLRLKLIHNNGQFVASS